MRNVEGELPAVEKSPFSYPFKLTLEQIERGSLQYESTLLDYEHSELAADGNWSSVYRALQVLLPKWLGTQTPKQLRADIVHRGEAAYIEKIWLDDLVSGRGDR